MKLQQTHPNVSYCNCSIRRCGLLYYFASAAVTVDFSHMTASSSASRSIFSPPSNFVNGHVSTMWFTVCHWPQSQEGDWGETPFVQVMERKAEWCEPAAAAGETHAGFHRTLSCRQTRRRVDRLRTTKVTAGLVASRSSQSAWPAHLHSHLHQTGVSCCVLCSK